MFSLNDSMRYLLYNRPTDMRKSFHTLSGIITDAMGQDPSNGNVYIFINRARDRIKLLHWEPGGMVLYSKLLEAGTLGKPDSANDNEVCTNIEWRELVSKHSKKCTFYTLRFGCSFAAVNTIKPQLL